MHFTAKMHTIQFGSSWLCRTLSYHIAHSGDKIELNRQWHTAQFEVRTGDVVYKDNYATFTLDVICADTVLKLGGGHKLRHEASEKLF